MWKLFAKAGIPLRFILTVHFDEESKSFWAVSPDVDGLVDPSVEMGIPTTRGGSRWEASIREQRKRIVDHLLENPSLKSKLPDIYQAVYAYAALGAIKATDIKPSTFPAQCPWTFEQIMDDTFWPETA